MAGSSRKTSMGWFNWNAYKTRACMVAVLAATLLPGLAWSGQTGSRTAPASHHAKIHHAAARRGAAARSSSTHHSVHGRAQVRTVSRHTRSRHHRHVLTAKELARSRKLKVAFVASSQLRPMAQELIQMRTPAAYAGVTAYAHQHTGEAASAAYLALGHAYLLDHKYGEAIDALHAAAAQGTVLRDYTAYLTVQAELQGSMPQQAQSTLSTFDQKYPDSIFVTSVPVLEANLDLEQGNASGALQALRTHAGEPMANRADYQLALAKAELVTGDQAHAEEAFRRVYLDFPLSAEAAQARSQLLASGTLQTLPPEERRRHADALYHAKRYGDAFEEYRLLAEDPTLDASARNSLMVAAASCDWKLNRLTKDELDRLPDTNDEAGARRLYLYMELARDKGDQQKVDDLIAQLETRFPRNQWLAEALYSAGNMYLLKADYPHAIQYYGELATQFPRSCEPSPSEGCSDLAPSSHWRAAWFNYRIGQYDQAARLFDQQITVYAGGKEMPAALYWRGRVYEQQEHKPDLAAAYYRAEVRLFPHYYYGLLAEQNLQQLGAVTPAAVPELDRLNPEIVPDLTDDVPEDDPHVVKARLLANAALNEYIAPEIRAAEGSDEWGAFAEAEIYSSDGENWRAMRLLKRELPFYTSAPIEAIPLAYWHILFPQPYWSQIQQSAAQNGLDPYMVASLIRQETEFNPGAVSNKSAYGLMQLLPSVGRTMAKEQGIHHFDTQELLNPDMNIRLGTLYLKQTLDKFGGHPEYAFAAYNAGDNRVVDWQNIGGYHDIAEWVESIPFTETREYVQAILRNEAMYREIDKLSAQQASLHTAVRK